MKRKTEKEMSETLAKALDCEADTSKLVIERIRARQLVKLLTAARVKHDLTQKEIAARMGCSESKVCRMEGAVDADLNFGDVVSYARAAGLSMSVLFDDSTLPNATRIRHCVYKIASMLKHLTELAKEEDEDDTIKNAINRFQVEVLMNFLIKYRESGAAIPPFTLSDALPLDEVRLAPSSASERHTPCATVTR